MAPRPPLPTDDLYLRLGVPPDASPEAIDIAWRGLLRIHHPDVAGPDGLDLAKRINVAHDWLSDPALRRRYDDERGQGSRARGRRVDGADHGQTARRSPRRRAPTTADRVAGIVERAARLTRDEVDRLALAEPAPIAFLATLRRFISADQQATLDAAERAAFANLPVTSRWDPMVRDAIAGKLAEIVLADVLDELLGDPSGIRARERLARGWDAAIGQPRYGPATGPVSDALARLSTLSSDQARALAITGSGSRLGDAPWPDGTSPQEDEALRVSSELAGADAAALVPAAARHAAARVAHLLVLRHAFSQGEFERLAAPWLGDLIPRAVPVAPRVRSRR
jgi:hypothetical protein